MMIVGVAVGVVVVLIVVFVVVFRVVVKELRKAASATAYRQLDTESVEMSARELPASTSVDVPPVYEDVDGGGSKM
jgi:flagellar biosynthesis/type III secretory pathway M-ring protein FliF/YscJ